MGNRRRSVAGRARTRVQATVDSLHRQRRRLERSSLARQVAVRRVGLLGLAALVAWAVTATVADAQATRAEWGHTVAVLVAERDLEPGELLDEGNAAVEQVPGRFVPDGALTSVPSNRRVTSMVAAGEMIVATRLAARDAGAMAARLPDGTQAVTVALGDAAAPVQPGDAVDVFVAAPTDAFASGFEDAPVTLSARAVARAATVLAVSASGVTLAVRDGQVADAVAAAAVGQVHLVITG